MLLYFSVAVSWHICVMDEAVGAAGFRAQVFRDAAVDVGIGAEQIWAIPMRT